MATRLLDYQSDGANRQAQAALAFLQYLLGDGIEESYNNQFNRYDADVRIGRWENCREQGYVLMLRTNDYKKQLNIAFFEHRVADCLCAHKWEQSTMNSPTIDSADFGANGYVSDCDVKHGEVVKMAEYLRDELINFWTENHEES